MQGKRIIMFILSVIFLIGLSINVTANNLTQRLISYYDFTNTSMAIDLVSGKNGTHSNVETGLTWGKIGNGVRYKGLTNSYTNLSPNVYCLDRTNSTINLWFMYLGGGSNYGRLFSFNNQTGNGNLIAYVNVPNSRIETVYYYITNKLVLATPSNTITTGTWYMYTVVFENNRQKAYLNGVNVANTTVSSNDLWGGCFVSNNLFGHDGGGSPYNGTIDEIGFWNRSLTDTEISLLYSNGTGLAYPFTNYIIYFFDTTPLNNSYVNNNTITIQVNTTGFNSTTYITLNIYNASGTLVNTTTINNNSLSYTTILNYGTYYYNATATDGTNTVYTETRTINIYNITLHTITTPINNYNQTSRYINITWTNATSNYPTVIYANNYFINLLNNNTIINRTIGNTTQNNYYYDLFIQNLTIGNYYMQVCANYTQNAGYYCINNSFNLINNAELLLYLKYNNGSTTINVTNYTLHDYTRSININTTTEPLIINIVKYNTYNFMINDTAGLYAYNYFNYSTSNHTNIQTIYLLPTNSINITIRDEYLYNIVTQNTTIKFEKTGSPISYTYTTSNGNLFPYNLVAGEYIMTITSTSPIVYNTKYYTINIYDRQTQEFTAYINNGGVVLLTYRSQTGQPLSNVNVNIYRTIGGNYTLVESLITQIDGRTQFNYIPNTKYIITSYLEGYDNLTFELNPVLFTSYDVTMRILESDIVEPSAYAEWTPNNFIRGQYGNITFKIYSPYCSLENYNIRTYINGILNFYYTNTNLCNDLIYIPYDFSNITSNTTLTIIYNYSLNNNKSQEFRYDYYIVMPLTNRTISSMGYNNFGFGIGDRVLIVTVINIVVFAVGFLFSGIIFGLFFVFLNTLIFVNANFIPAPLFYIIFVVGLIIIMSNGVKDG